MKYGDLPQTYTHAKRALFRYIRGSTSQQRSVGRSIRHYTPPVRGSLSKGVRLLLVKGGRTQPGATVKFGAIPVGIQNALKLHGGKAAAFIFRAPLG